MKTGKIEIAGVTYMTCLSTRVLMNLQKRGGGDLTKSLADIEKSEDLGQLMDLVHQLIEAGARYAKLAGIDNPEPISFDDMVDIMGIDDIESLRDAFTGAVIESAPAVEILDHPNMTASQEKK